MKRVVIGCAFFAVGALCSLAIFIFGAAYIPDVTAYSRDVGRFWTGIIDGHLVFPLILSILLFVGGLVILLAELIGKPRYQMSTSQVKDTEN